MRLLFDHNLSPRLVYRLADPFPDANHVALLALDRATDEQVWEYARAAGYTIVTKDADFAELGALRGYPPRVIPLRIGNCTTRQIEELLRHHREVIVAFHADPSAGALELWPPGDATEV